MIGQGLVALGVALPQGILASSWFVVLSAFVAVNTVMYVALAVAKMLPKIYAGDYVSRRYQRSQTRSIHPDGRV